MTYIQKKQIIDRVDILVEKGVDELLSDAVYTLGGNGFWLEDRDDFVLLKCYPNDTDDFLEKISTSGLNIVQLHVEKEELRDYAELTSKYFRPIRIDNLRIRAPWNKKKGNGREIIIEPGMAFGTGRHESTRIMIRMMKDIAFGGKTVLDIGCGSAILSLYASLLGAERIYAVDNDLDAVLNAKKNATLNGTDTISVACASLDDIQGIFDVVLANIDIKTFSAHSEKVANLAKKDGFLLLSGVLRKNKDQLLDLFQSHGWHLMQHYQKNSWCGFLLGNSR